MLAGVGTNLDPARPGRVVGVIAILRQPSESEASLCPFTVTPRGRLVVKLISLAMQGLHCIRTCAGCKFQRSRVAVRPFTKCVAILCLLLTISSAVAVVAHHHSNGIDTAKCSICAAAHSTAPKAAANPTVTAFTSHFAFRSVSDPAKEQVVAFALSVRPPPAS